MISANYLFDVNRSGPRQAAESIFRQPVLENEGGGGFPGREGGGFRPGIRTDPLPIAPAAPQTETLVMLVARFGLPDPALRRRSGAGATRDIQG